MCEVHQPSCSVPAAVDRCVGDPPRPSLDPSRTTSPILSREVGALLDTAAEVLSGIVLSVDEIDDHRTDTFRPFVSDKAEAGATPKPFCLKSPLKEMQTFSVMAEPSVSNMLTYFVTPLPHSLPN
jgi:hypothetical protein